MDCCAIIFLARAWSLRISSVNGEYGRIRMRS